MTAAEIVKQLAGSSEASYKRILLNHGAREPVLGVKVAELKKLQKQLRPEYRLAQGLYETGIYDAQYLAGLIADDARMTKSDLRRWLSKSNSPPISATAVAWVAAESRFGRELALEWIDSKKEDPAQTGWTTLSALVSTTDDSALDLPELKKLLDRVGRSIHQEQNLVRYAMNGFVIAVGCYVRELTAAATRVAEKVGTVSVDMGNTACEVPAAADYIRKVQQRGTIGKKRKTARC